ncbi:DUF2249 domain-containing protein [Halapricum sp. CBA1109]|uniref:DUF2249 domain-containing protein n=1 Tax=Halapricum sp. CBA1109 TaxID=2668068 RepID=UPI0012FA703B|nr:DUF2249 domain-containing protein [Halapricum sp. CBA1109]MUV89101.1 DUF2249 domain-containing protein [Halapricum sp. CBA1109]
MVQRTADDVDATLDAREIDGEPFGEIMAALEDLGDDETLRLINSFEPEPLYDVLDERGFDHETTEESAEEFHVDIQSADDGDADVQTTVDVREIPKPDRHPQVHDTYAGLDVGESMALVAPHEPRPLEHEFDQQYGDAFAWEVVERDTGTVRVRVRKEAAASGGDPTDSDDVAAGSSDGLSVTETLDVRELPPAQRHEVIFDTYADLDGGEAFVLVNDHDPKPLYHQFDAEAGPGFVWEYRKQEPGEFRVLIGKAGDASPAGDAPF